MRRAVLFGMLVGSYSVVGQAQDITVHVVEGDTKRPVADIYLNLRSDCFNEHRPSASQQKTDSSGTAVFRSVTLAGQPLCLDLFSTSFASLQVDYIFASTDKEIKSGNPVITSLPADVTFRVKKRSFIERLQFIFQGP